MALFCWKLFFFNWCVITRRAPRLFRRRRRRRLDPPRSPLGSEVRRRAAAAAAGRLDGARGGRADADAVGSYAGPLEGSGLVVRSSVIEKF